MIDKHTSYMGFVGHLKVVERLDRETHAEEIRAADKRWVSPSSVNHVTDDSEADDITSEAYDEALRLNDNPVFPGGVQNDSYVNFVLHSKKTRHCGYCDVSDHYTLSCLRLMIDYVDNKPEALKFHKEQNIHEQRKKLLQSYKDK